MSCRFVEVSEIYIQDERRESRFRVVIKHATGAQETFESKKKSRNARIPCQT